MSIDRHTHLALTAFACAALALGCATDSETSSNKSPIVDRGACATIIMPGQSVPMGSRPSCPDGMSALGRTAVDDQREKREKSEPLPGTDIVRAPLGAVAAPVVAAERAVRKATSSREQSSSGNGSAGRSSSSGTPESSPAPEVSAAPVSQSPHAAWERAQLEAIERQLGGPAPSAPRAAPLPSPGIPGAGVMAAPIVAAGAIGMSIADELAALQARTRPTASLPPEPVLEVPGSVRAESGGLADRVSDRNGDARPDHWEYREDGKLIRELFDENGDGRPDRTVHFDLRTGLEAHVEEDRNLDGRLDSWIDYRDGQLARQRRDTDYDGIPDHWSFYRHGELARQEIDLNGDGFRNRIAFFEGGRLVREREDRDGDGRTDRVTHYDRLERVSRRDEDRDGDGMIDTRSLYENGRLARQEMVSDELVAIEGEELTTSEWSSGDAN